MILIDERNVNGIFEGANIPISLDGQSYIRENDHKVMYIPGKASNAGGVGVSGFEMSQNAQKIVWDSTLVDQKLQSLMKNIYEQLVEVGGKTGSLEIGANQAGFLKIVQAMVDLGWLG
jgi:glutamate dehydrogenase (NADP+)